MDGKSIAALLKKRREKWVEVGPGKRIMFLRPPEADLTTLLVEDDKGGTVWRITGEHVKKYVTNWEGFTEADFLGASGAGDPQEFDTDLFAAYVGDDMTLSTKIGRAILDSVVDHITSKEATTGN